MVVTNQQMAIASAMKDTTYSASSQFVYGKGNANLASKKYQVNPKNSINSNLSQSKEELVLRKTYGNKWADLDLEAKFESLYH